MEAKPGPAWGHAEHVAAAGSSGLPRGLRRTLVGLALVLTLATGLILGIVVLGGRMGDLATVQRLGRFLDTGVSMLAHDAARRGEAARASSDDEATLLRTLERSGGVAFAGIVGGDGAAAALEHVRQAALALLPADPGTAPEVGLLPWDGQPHLLLRVPLERERTLLALLPLGAAFFDEVLRGFVARPVRFAATPDAGADELAHPLHLAGGPVAGYLMVQPFYVGRQILVTTVLPVAGLAVAVLLGTGLWLLQRLGAAARSAALREAQARFLALHDELTGLPNRRAFHAAAGRLLASARPVAIAMLDLDRFKQVNDTLGHQAGDLMIRAAAGRLRAALGAEAVVARLGGDEFAVAMPLDDGGNLEALRAARAACDAPYVLDGNVAHVSASAGVALAPLHARDASDLLRMADIALFQAKAAGRGCLAAFDAATDEGLRLRASLDHELRLAVEREQFVLHYQPVVDARSETLTGVEALVRWQHPERGLVPPGHFLPLLEENGLIVPLGQWVLRQAMRDSLRLGDLRIAVNVSPAQLRDPGLAEFARAALAETGADARRIELEVTETIFLDDEAMITDRLRALRAMGFTLALDDFGTGFSSLGYLRRIVLDRLKVDQSFVCAMETSEQGRAIVGAMAQLANALGLAVTAEGVESEDAALLLRGMGCTHLQGFRYGRAMPLEELPAGGGEAARRAA